MFVARGITKIYTMGEVQVHALRGVDLEIYASEFVVLLGPSGCGKSTLLNILGGLDTPSSGSARWRDHDLTHASDVELTHYRREHVGFVFQFYNLIPSLTARENVTLVTEMAKRPMRPEEALEWVGLGDRLDHYPSQMSGGEQQRVAIARAIAKRPDAIAYRNLGHLYTLQLRFEDAIRVLETGLALTDTDWWSWRLLGEAQHFTGRQRKADTAWRRARLLASERLTLNPADVEALSGLAEIHAALGEAETAQLYLARLRSLPLKWNVISFYTGRASEMVSQRDAAFSFLERALQQGLSTRWMEVDPWLGQLRQDPRYRVLLNRFSKR